MLDDLGGCNMEQLVSLGANICIYNTLFSGISTSTLMENNLTILT